MKAAARHGLRREPRRRRRHARRHGGQARRRRRPHHRARQHQHHGAQHHDHQQSGLRSRSGTSCRSRSSASAPASIAVNPSVPATNVKELIAYVKANTGKLSYGSAGTGTMSHLSGELFKQRTGTDRRRPCALQGRRPGPRRSRQRPHPDHVAEHHRPAAGIPQRRQDPHPGGRIRRTRLKAAPDIPTAIEQGVPNMVGQLFLGIFAPAATPKPAIEAMAAATKKARRQPSSSRRP